MNFTHSNAILKTIRYSQGVIQYVFQVNLCNFYQESYYNWWKLHSLSIFKLKVCMETMCWILDCGIYCIKLWHFSCFYVSCASFYWYMLINDFLCVNFFFSFWQKKLQETLWVLPHDSWMVNMVNYWP